MSALSAEQQIRVAALQAAARATYPGTSATSVIARAELFERWIIWGSIDPSPDPAIRVDVTK